MSSPTPDRNTNNRKDQISTSNIYQNSTPTEFQLSSEVTMSSNLEINGLDKSNPDNISKDEPGLESTDSLILMNMDGEGDNPIATVAPSHTHIKPETWLKMTLQMAIPLFVAGLGMTGAGLLLNHVKGWKVFRAINELLILTTPLLGLKGDLEMTLASRISTQANLGNMKTWSQTWEICFANLCLDQLQAAICGILAAILAIIIGVSDEPITYKDAILLCASSCTTASIVSLVLGSVMCTVIILALELDFNPDNIATPVAGSLGDVVTLGSLALIAKFLYANRDGYPWLPYIFLGVSVLSLPFCGYVAHRSKFTREIIKSGWAPVLISVVISSGGGLVLEQSSGKYTSLALYQPLINGIGGNMVCILASRLATQFHRDNEKGVLPGNSQSICMSPRAVFLEDGENGTAARILMILVIPLQLAFVGIIYFCSDVSIFNIGFIALFETASFIQLLSLLYSARILANLCWKRGWDPDTSSIPYLTALGDLVGSSLLLLVFVIYEHK